jgi:Family of unknown function (DUF6193)
MPPIRTNWFYFAEVRGFGRELRKLSQPTRHSAHKFFCYNSAMLLEKELRQALIGVSTDLTIHSSSPAWAVVKRNPRHIQMVATTRPEFSLDFWMQGVEYGVGGAADFSDVVASIFHFLIDWVPLRTMASRFSWFKPSAGGLAHEQGAQEFVSYEWSELERWVTCIDLPKPVPVILNLGPIVREAAERPELRQLRPFTSLFALCFSRTTGYPFPRDCPHAEPIGNDLYRVTSADSKVLFDSVDVVQAVDALVASLPPNCGPAIQGTSEDM